MIADLEEWTRSAPRMAVPPIGAIDCDVHPALPGMKALVPYLDDHWREQVVNRGIDGMDSSSFPVNATSECRADWRPASGKPGSEPSLLVRQALDDFDSRYAICNCLYGVQSIQDANLAASTARAINKWMAAQWLEKDQRLRASIIISVKNVDLAVEEIERLAPDKRFVQVLLIAGGEIPYGKRMYWPIYAAAEKHGLPIGVHAGYTAHFAPSSTGWPSYFVEDYVNHALTCQAQLLSFITEGVFTKFPTLKVVFVEAGFTWLPGCLWRAVKTWRGTRIETPWVTRSPAEIIRDNIRFTLQPCDLPPKAEQFERILDQMGSDKFLLFSTDYPHNHFDGIDALPANLSGDLVRKICVENPLETYSRLEAASP